VSSGFSGFPEQARRDWAHRRWAKVDGVFDRDTCARWDAGVRGLPTRDTYYPANPNLRWQQTSFEQLDVDPCDGLLHDSGFLAAIERVTGLQGLAPERSMTWINRYAPGDEVPAHRDHFGDVQVLVCLRAPEPGQGGQTYIGDTEVSLATGDVLIWHARVLEHGMTRIATSAAADAAGACRVVCVFRFKAESVR